MSSSEQDRLTELETKVSYLELANQELSDLIYQMQQQTDKHFRQILQQLSKLEDTQEQESPSEEVPPHY